MSAYRNTLPPEHSPEYPGNLKTEQRIESLIRWNAMAMVVSANRDNPGIGGHISTFASIATLYEVGQNHFFRGSDGEGAADLVYFQGHASPGNYSRAFLEGRFDKESLKNFRRDTKSGGLSSYPHPRLMPDFWQFPTVSMGLGPITSIYQARFSKYLQARELTSDDPHVWAFVGDGEMDEPESLAALSLAARENLNNLTWVVNCNLQRLDGPVRGNKKIIQEFERIFLGAGWNVIKLVWGSGWDDLFAKDDSGRLQERLEQMVDGDYQRLSAASGKEIRRSLFEGDKDLKNLGAHLTDKELEQLKFGGHDRNKVYTAYRAAMDFDQGPTVILAKTVKGFGLGEAGAGLNTTHQQKTLTERELRNYRDYFGLAISDATIAETPFFRPAESSPEISYLQKRRKALGGFLPRRNVHFEQLEAPKLDAFGELLEGDDKGASTTMAFLRLLNMTMRNKHLGSRIVPIIPDEARTFGLDALFQQYGIYASGGQQYEPVDSDHLLYYREDKQGQILEEGITEAGAMSTFIAAGTSYATRGLEILPCYLFYSMFGFQRIEDLIWAAEDSLAKGFLLGCTAGRTTLNGEGLQHQDGHSLLTASAHPGIVAYDPAFAYEVAVIVQAGLEQMLGWNEPVIYYLTLYNESLLMPPMESIAPESILKGLYCFRRSEGHSQAHLFASGTLMKEAMQAQQKLADKFNINVDLWSVTSYERLRNDALESDKWNLNHPDQPKQKSYLETVFKDEQGPIVAVSDYVRLVPDQIAQWMPEGFISLGTDDFGRSGTRQELRQFFGTDADSICAAVISQLVRQDAISKDAARKAIHKLKPMEESENGS